MSVEFNEGGIPRRDFNTQKTPKIAEWIIKKGWAKDVAGANKIQVISSLLFFGLAIYFFLK